MSTLKLKQLVMSPTEWVYLRTAEELQFGTGKLWQTIGTSKDQRRGMLLYGEKEEIGKAYFRQKSLEGKQEFRV